MDVSANPVISLSFSMVNSALLDQIHLYPKFYFYFLKMSQTGYNWFCT